MVSLSPDPLPLTPLPGTLLLPEALQSAAFVPALENISDAIAIADTKHRIRFVNQNFEELFGYSRTELLGEDFRSLLANRLPQEDTSSLESLKATQESHSQRKITTKLGQELDIHLTVATIQDESGNHIGFLSKARDITQHRWAEESLRFLSNLGQAIQTIRSTHDLFQRVGEALKVRDLWVTFLLLESEGQYLRVAHQTVDDKALRAVSKILGMSIGDLPRRLEAVPEYLRAVEHREITFISDRTAFYHAFLPEAKKGDADRVARIMGRGRAESVVLPLIAQDRVLGLMALRGPEPLGKDTDLLMVFAGQVSAALENAMLYEEQIRQEGQLRQAWDFNERIINSISIVLAVVSSDLKVVSANRAFRNVFALRSGQVENKPLARLLSLGEVAELVSDALGTPDQPIRRELIYADPHMGRRFFVASASRFRWHEGTKGEAVLLSLEDVTEQRQMQEKIKDSSQLISLGEIIGGVAHELNNPLTSVQGFAQLLMEQRSGEPPQRELEIIFTEAQRAVRVVQNLLSFVRKRKPNKVPVDILRLR